ncbi:MAG TPA: winged helix DNA-binding domain-containing protein [Solirubrobacteraceae bacterium]|nr:winged helix DNA-binding domain-containing protein [Solirubrobacteraceae bacterium]
MDAAELRGRRAAAQLLHRPAGLGAADVVRALLAVQAQHARAARLALRARTEGLTAAAVDAALSDERSLVAGWLARGTLHLVASEDYAWLLGLTAPGRVAGSERRLRQEGVSAADAERAVAIVERALEADGPLTRAQLAERLGAAGIRTAGQATPHLLGLAARRGVAVLGPVRDGERAFALTRDWLGAAPELPLTAERRDAALAELARRYLSGHGPAGAADLAAWAGLPLRDARAGLRAIGGELVELAGGLVDLARRPEPAPGALAPRLLGAFDPYLLGWKDRGLAVPAVHAKRVHPGGGILRAVATAGGVAVGTWSARRRAGALAIAVEPFGRLDAGVTAALDREAADVMRFEALERE